MYTQLPQDLFIFSIITMFSFNELCLLKQPSHVKMVLQVNAARRSSEPMRAVRPMVKGQVLSLIGLLMDQVMTFTEFHQVAEKETKEIA